MDVDVKINISQRVLNLILISSFNIILENSI